MTPDPETIRLPLLDQLIDEDPGKSVEAPLRSGQAHEKLMRAIRRDLIDLLNTRERSRSWPKELRNLDDSVLNYGLPDITGANFGASSDRENFLQTISKVVRNCDKRFESVEVQALDSRDPHDRTLRFRIDATFRLEVGSENVSLDFHLEPVSRSFE